MDIKLRDEEIKNISSQQDDIQRRNKSKIEEINEASKHALKDLEDKDAKIASLLLDIRTKDFEVEKVQRLVG
jgi:hypothetical protein